jgi:hypothetical protein
VPFSYKSISLIDAAQGRTRRKGSCKNKKSRDDHDLPGLRVGYGRWVVAPLDVISGHLRLPLTTSHPYGAQPELFQVPSGFSEPASPFPDAPSVIQAGDWREQLREYALRRLRAAVSAEVAGEEP